MPFIQTKNVRFLNKLNIYDNIIRLMCITIENTSYLLRRCINQNYVVKFIFKNVIDVNKYRVFGFTEKCVYPVSLTTIYLRRI